MADPVLLWFRQDLRLADHAALDAAIADGPVIPVYILDDETPGERRMGGASRWWLHRSLASLDRSLTERGSRLILRRGRSDVELAKLAREVGANRVHALRHYEHWWRDAEEAVAGQLDLCLDDGRYLAPPGAVTTGSGEPYKIFTPFWRALRQRAIPPACGEAPRNIPVPDTWPASDTLDDWALLPTRPNWASGFDADWTPGEAGALRTLDAFLPEAADYDRRRNLPSEEGSSRLSPHLHWGEISPALAWHRAAGVGGSVDVFLSELAWRDYAQNVIMVSPDYPERNARDRFDAMPWRTGPDAATDLSAWQQGRTGYPIVDAGMRQLWATGWMHNRVRMIAASFLIKHLLIDWREGERWFWDTLVDADYASNGVNWQWVAGTGIDSNMFSRIMAPLSQSDKFDAGDYIRHWVPELRELKGAAIHDPETHGVRPAAYPRPIIGHREARERALAAYGRIRT